MKYSFKSLFLGFALICALPSAMAEQNTESFAKYHNAKLAVNYTGNVGYFVQQLAYKLNIGFYSAQTNPGIKISVQQDKSKSFDDLLNSINQQLGQHHLILTTLADKPTLALVTKQTNALELPQYIGEVVFDESATEVPAKKQQPSEEPMISIENNDSSSLPATQPVVKVRDAATIEQENKMNEIIKVSQDTDLIAKYTRREPPIYTVENQAATLLETIRSTKLSTFLVFKNDVDASKYDIKAEVQDIAKVGNIVGLLHRQKPAPKTITIANAEGKETIVTKTN